MYRYFFNRDKFKPDVLVQVVNARFVYLTVVGGHVTFDHPEVLALAVGYCRHFQPIQPLLDWATKNVGMAGRYYDGEWHPASDDDIDRYRRLLETMVEVVLNGEYE